MPAQRGKNHIKRGQLAIGKVYYLINVEGCQGLTLMWKLHTAAGVAPIRVFGSPSNDREVMEKTPVPDPTTAAGLWALTPTQFSASPNGAVASQMIQFDTRGLARVIVEVDVTTQLEQFSLVSGILTN
jgi:hypothetical protein